MKLDGKIGVFLLGTFCKVVRYLFINLITEIDAYDLGLIINHLGEHFHCRIFNDRADRQYLMVTDAHDVALLYLHAAN